MAGRRKESQSEAVSELLNSLMQEYSTLSDAVSRLRRVSGAGSSEQKNALRIAEKKLENIKTRIRALTKEEEEEMGNPSGFSPTPGTAKKDKARRRQIFQHMMKLNSKDEIESDVIALLEIIGNEIPRQQKLADEGNVPAFEAIRPLMDKANELYAKFLMDNDRTELTKLMGLKARNTLKPGGMLDVSKFQLLVDIDAKIKEVEERIRINPQNPASTSSSPLFDEIQPYSQRELDYADSIAEQKRTEFENARKENERMSAASSKKKEKEEQTWEFGTIEKSPSSNSPYSFGAAGEEIEVGRYEFGASSPENQEDTRFSWGASLLPSPARQKEQSTNAPRTFEDLLDDEDDDDPHEEEDAETLLQNVHKIRDAEIEKSPVQEKPKILKPTEEELQTYQKDQNWVNEIENNARRAFEAIYNEIKLAFFDPVPAELPPKKWNDILKNITNVIVSSDDVPVVSKRYTKFLTNKELSVPLSLVEVAFVASMFAAKTPYLATLDIVLELVPKQTKYDFATLALFLSGAVLFPGGLSGNFFKRLEHLGFVSNGKIEGVYDESQLDAAEHLNTETQAYIRNTAIGVIRGLSTVVLPSGAKIAPAGFAHFTGKKRFPAYSNLSISVGRESEKNENLFVELSSKRDPEFPYNVTTKATRTKGSSARRKRPATEDAARAVESASKSIKKAGGHLDYSSDVLATLKSQLGADSETYKNLLALVDDYSNKHAGLEQQHEILKKQFDALVLEDGARRQELDKANAELRGCLENLERALETSSQETSKLLEQLKTREAEVEQLEKTIENLERTVRSLTEEFASAEARIAELEAEGAALRRNVDELSRAQNADQQSLVEKDEQIATLRVELENSRTEVFGLRVGLDTEADKLREVIKGQDLRISELSKGDAFAKADWKNTLTLAIINGSSDLFKNALFYHQFEYQQKDLREVVRLGGEKPVLASNGVVNAVIVKADLSKIYEALNVTCRKYIALEEIFKVNVKRAFLLNKTRDERVAFVAIVLREFGVNTKGIEKVISSPKPVPPQ